MSNPHDRNDTACWLCSRPSGGARLTDGLCAECCKKGEGIEIPFKMEEYDRMRALHRLIASAVFSAIRAADEASADDERNRKEYDQ